MPSAGAETERALKSILPYPHTQPTQVSYFYPMPDVKLMLGGHIGWRKLVAYFPEYSSEKLFSVSFVLPQHCLHASTSISSDRVNR